MINIPKFYTKYVHFIFLNQITQTKKKQNNMNVEWRQ